ncbi:galactosyltransferase-related protein [Herbiconiux sp. CPCC 205716]|uniref:Galactosyltransferase-related protein n=1 Tax=Herbiconiux gentiana TaxID=2970912 RepID=A0ABT2GGM9_9MICO|nr:galactosyltransferase-related protein [Herbiconiux gentiana]MCS5714049.1 galactosyltransferase-related protein [Herbiconiux gentiana]
MIAVITAVAGRRLHLARQEEWLARYPSGRRTRRVVVAMDDAPIATPSDPRATVLRVPADGRALPLAEARNAGAEAAIAAGAELLVFLDVDCLPRPGLLDAYDAAARRRPDALLTGSVAYLPEGVDYTRPETFEAVGTVHGFRPRPEPGILEPAAHELFWSLSFACTPETWRRIGGFDEGYLGYGGEDTDFGFAARAAGVDLLFAGGAEADHQHHPVSDPPVEHLDDILRNTGRFTAKWGAVPMRGWLDAFAELGLVTHDPTTDRYAATPPTAQTPAAPPTRPHPRTDAA